MTGRHCGPELGAWAMDGTYDRQGAKGVQHWDITIGATSASDPAARTGTYTYTDKAQMVQGPVTVYLDGQATGNVTLRRDSGGRALMHFEETAHSFRTTTSLGGQGQDQNAPLAVFDVVWEVDPSCP